MTRLFTASKLLVLVLLQFALFGANGQTVVINEFMSDNDTTLQDADGDYSDWIELYNLGPIPVNLEGFSLTDDLNIPGLWQFPNVSIPPDSFILVFASGKNAMINGEIHTNFRISSSGEPLKLFNEQGLLLDIMPPQDLDEDQSFGRFQDGSGTLTQLVKATPDASNSASNTVICSHESGWYQDDINVHISSSDPSFQIRYTLNGERPTVTDALISGSLGIHNVSDGVNRISDVPLTPLEGPDQLYTFIWKKPKSVYKANVLRYAMFNGSERIGKVHTKTFFIDPDFPQRYSFPIVSVVTDSLSLFDHDTGIMVPGVRFEEEGFEWIPAGNYHNDGFDWERLANISFLSHDGELHFEREAGIRIRGFGSAVMPQKSLNAFFRSEYGAKRIEHDVFPVSDGVTKFKRLIFRNSGNDFLKTHFRDAFLHRISVSLDLEVQRMQPSIMFINGEYWGIQNIREKIDEFHFKYALGIEKDDLIMVNPCGSYEYGDHTVYDEMEDFVYDHDLSLKQNYDTLCEMLDLNNFIDYMILEIYSANIDWPRNNHKVWRATGQYSKWRHIAYDLDFSTGFLERNKYDHASLDHAVTVGTEWPWRDCSNIIFRKLLENDEFVNLFLTRFEYHLNHTFESKSLASKLDEMSAIYRPEMDEHIERWGYPESVDRWEQYVEEMKKFIRKRPCFLREHIADFFQVEQLNVSCDSIEVIEGDVMLFPNPASDQLVTVNLNHTGADDWTVQLLSVDGKPVSQQQFSGQQTMLDIAGLPSGLYLVIASSSTQVLRENLIIAK